MKIINRLISDLVPADYNPRTLTDKQFKDIKKSLTRFGFVDPIIVNTHPSRKDVIIGGHQRCKVWASMGNDTVPTVELCLTIKEEQELNVRLNKNTGEFDFDALANFFDVEDLQEWGFEAFEFGLGDGEESIESKEKDLSDQICVNFKIEINCVSETEQKKLYNELIERGLECRILTL